jgi:hypothetical protein
MKENNFETTGKSHWEKREKRKQAEKQKQPISGRSVFLLEKIKREKALKALEEKNKKKNKINK